MSTDPLPDTWHHRDLPVLREAVRLGDHHMGDWFHATEVEAALPHLDPDDIQRAAIALHSASLIETTGDHERRVGDIRRPSARARQLAGSWPTPETALDRMVAALEKIATDPATPVEDRSAARRFVTWLTSSGTNVGVAVTSAVITGQVT